MNNSNSLCEILDSKWQWAIFYIMHLNFKNYNYKKLYMLRTVLYKKPMEEQLQMIPHCNIFKVYNSLCKGSKQNSIKSKGRSLTPSGFGATIQTQGMHSFCYINWTVTGTVEGSSRCACICLAVPSPGNLAHSNLWVLLFEKNHIKHSFANFLFKLSPRTSSLGDGGWSKLTKGYHLLLHCPSHSKNPYLAQI